MWPVLSILLILRGFGKFFSYPIKVFWSPAVSSEGSVGSVGAPGLQPLLHVGRSWRGFWGWGLLPVTGRVVPTSSLVWDPAAGSGRNPRLGNHLRGVAAWLLLWSKPAAMGDAGG